MYNKKPYF